MKLRADVLKLRAAGGGFRIARDVTTDFENVIVELHHGGQVGLGEAAPRPYFHGEDVPRVLRTVRKAGLLLGDDPFQIQDITSRLAAAFPASPAARAAIDMALHDLVGKILRRPVWQLLGLNPRRMPPTSFTIGLDEPEAMARRAAAVKGFKVLKIKLGTDRDDERLRAIRRATKLPLRADANTGWTKKQAVETINRLAKYRVEFVEQPVPPGDNAALRYIHRRARLPIMADESAQALGDLPGLVGCVAAINIKLMKCGGLREALRMIHFARASGLKIMLGCMLETSLAVTAAAQLGPLVDYVDLDGNLLIEDDPFEGAVVRRGRLVLPARPGLGVRCK